MQNSSDLCGQLAQSALDTDITEISPHRFDSSCFQSHLRRESGTTTILFRPTLHQINDHRKQMIPGLNPLPRASDIENDDVDASSRGPKIDRWHGAELWRAL